MGTALKRRGLPEGHDTPTGAGSRVVSNEEAVSVTEEEQLARLKAELAQAQSDEERRRLTNQIVILQAQVRSATPEGGGSSGKMVDSIGPAYGTVRQPEPTKAPAPPKAPAKAPPPAKKKLTEHAQALRQKELDKRSRKR